MRPPTTRDVYHTLLDAAALDGSDEIALIYLENEAPPVTLSRRDFLESVQRYAGALRGLGVGPRDLVIVAHTQNLESIYLFWAALWLGAIPSMFPTLTEKLDRSVYAANMAELVRLSQVKAVFTTDDFAPELDRTVGCPVYGSVSRTQAAPAPHQADPTEVAFLQHSSGTTGLQKGVALSHQAVLNQLADYGAELHLTGDDVIISWLPLYHDMGLIAGFLLPLVAGVPLVLMSPFDWVRHPGMLLRAIHAYKGTLCWLPNFAYNHMARRIRDRDIAGVRLVSVRAFINCSEPVRADSHAKFIERFAPYGLQPEMLAVSYAMAENTFAVTQTRLGEPPTIDKVDALTLETEQRATPGDEPKVSCGPPLTGTQVRVLGDDGNPLPERHVGQLAVRSTYMLTEYYRRPDLDPFTPEGWYLTGDMGYIAEGEVYVIGRQKDLIINAGKNIYPQDIEAIVNTVEGVKPGRAVAFGVPDEREGTELIAVVAEVTEADPQARKRINQDIRKTVAAQTTVSVNFVSLVGPKWLIKTSSGKIARAANRQKWLADRA